MWLLNPDKFWLEPLKCKFGSNWRHLRQTSLLPAAVVPCQQKKRRLAIILIVGQKIIILIRRKLQSTQYWCSVCSEEEETIGNKLFIWLSDGLEKNCQVNETHNSETTHYLNLVFNKLTSSGEWAASLPQPSFGGLGRCRWTGWTDWNGTGASKLRSSPLPSHPPQLSTKLSQEAAIWASTPFSTMPILGLTIQFGCTSSLCLFLGTTKGRTSI